MLSSDKLALKPVGMQRHELPLIDAFRSHAV